MPSVTTVFRKDKLNKNNEAPIHLRIIKDRKISYISTGIMLNQSNWDESKNRVKTTFKGSARLNSFISNKHTELQDQVFEHETISKSLTTRQLRDKIYGKKATDFIQFAEEACKQYLDKGKIGTYDKCISIIKKLKTYASGRALTFNDIDVAFITKYEGYLRGTLNNKTNTVHKDLKFFRKLFNDAFRLDLIDLSLNPFLKYRLKQAKTNTIYLTEDELMKIENYQPTHGKKLELHKDMYIFSSYAGGIRVSDVLQLKFLNYDGSHINFTTQKTSRQMSVKLPDAAKLIIEKYRTEDKGPESYIFPMLPDGLDTTNLRLVDSHISSSTAYINKNLKIVAKECEISKVVSFHSSRHSFITRALRKGISIDKVSRIAGHSAIRETERYSHIISAELDNAMDQAFN